MSHRINIESAFWDDPRFIELQSRTTAVKAIAHCVLSWKLAQSFWLQGERLISEEVWKNHRLPDALIEVGLARREEGGIYVCGTKTACKWIQSSIENGKKGGRPKLKIANKIEGNDNPTLNRNESEPEPERNLHTHTHTHTQIQEDKDSSAEVSKTTPRPETANPPLVLEQFSKSPASREILERGRVTEAVQEAWVETYPDVNWLNAEIGKARIWMLSNPRKAPTPKGTTRFLSGWFERGWDKYRKTIASRPGESLTNTRPMTEDELKI